MAKGFRLGMLALTLAFGMMATGCNGRAGDEALNGTWAVGGLELRFSEGRWEERRNGRLFSRGRYTTNDDTLYMTVTHLRNYERWRWRRSLTRVVARERRGPMMIGATGEVARRIRINREAARDVGRLFEPQIWEYSVSDNALTLDNTVLRRR